MNLKVHPLDLFVLVSILGCAEGSKYEHSLRADTSADTGFCATSTWYADADNDGFGDAAASTTACVAPEHTVSNATDCDDTRADVHPGAEEICGDRVVNDCDDTNGEEATAFCTAMGPFDLSLGDAKLIGEAAGDEAASDLAGAGDVNGDDRSDLLVVAWYHHPGTIYLVSGPVSGDLDLGGATARILSASEDPDDRLFTARSGGDVDGDGFSDVVTGGGLAEAYLLFGPLTGDLDIAEADVAFYGETYDWAGDGTGYSVAGLGDVDGDGLSDLLIGAPSANGRDVESDVGDCTAEDEVWAHGEFAGRALLFLGPRFGSMSWTDADALLIGEDGGDGAGHAVARPGDLNGDGLADLFLSAPGNCEGGDGAGAAYVVLSPVSGEVYLEDADAKIYGSGSGANAGKRMSGAGDTDGDGTPDLLVSEPAKDLSRSDLSAGEVYLFSGPVSGSQSVRRADAKFLGSDFNYAGDSVSSAGDIDADGFDDIVIGAWGVDGPGTNSGETYILYGPMDGSYDLLEDADTIFVGRASSESGWSVAGTGDVDADGLSDILAGARTESVGVTGTDAGAAYLLLGGGALLNGNGEI